MNYLNGISGISGLGELSETVRNSIRANKNIIDSVLKDASVLNGFGDVSKAEKKTMSFSEVVARYNKGITADEIKIGRASCRERV